VALYAAYGSNMDPAQMLLRCPHSPQRGTGWLEGWRLTFGGEDLGWDGALTTLVEDPAQRVFVALYDVPEVDEKELDSWDGVNLGFYSKIKVRVQSLDGDVLAWLYVLDAYEGGLPSDRRLSILVDAAIKAGAPSDYIDWLRVRPSNPPALSSGGRPRTPGWPPAVSGQGGDEQGECGDEDRGDGWPVPGGDRRRCDCAWRV
jgi:AIG2 family protein